MHAECRWFVEAAVKRCNLKSWKGLSVLEFGSLDINGGVRDLFPDAEYMGVDIVPGPGVDHVGNAATWTTARDLTFDVVLCLEVFEHTPEWRNIVANMAKFLKVDGIAIMTAACDPRAPHSAVDGHNMEPEEYTDKFLTDDPGPRGSETFVPHGVEYYANVDPKALEDTLLYNFARHEINTLHRGDVQALAWKQ
jgi:SAM-dependent methyltransferase